MQSTEKLYTEEYIRALVNPLSTPRVVPPRTSLLPSVIKQVRIQTLVDITNAAQQSGMFMTAPDLGNLVRWYLFSSAENRYRLYRVFYPNELIEDDFARYDFISGIFSLKNDNVSLLNTTLGGSIFGTRVGQLPNFGTLNFDNVPVYSIAQESSTGLLSMQDGISALILRSSDNNMDNAYANISPLPQLAVSGLLGTNGIASGSNCTFPPGYVGTVSSVAGANSYNVLYANAPIDRDDYLFNVTAALNADSSFPIPGPFTINTTNVSTQVIFDTNTLQANVQNVFWQNSYGLYELEFDMRIQATVNHTFTGYVQVDHPYIDSAFVLQNGAQCRNTFPFSSGAAANNSSTVMRVQYYAAPELSRIQVFWTPSVNLGTPLNLDVRFTVANLSGGLNKHFGSRTLMPYRNVTLNTALQINGVFNAEAIPNYVLSRNLKGSTLPFDEDAYENAVKILRKLLTRNLVTVTRLGQLTDMLNAGGNDLAVSSTSSFYAGGNQLVAGPWWGPAARWFKGGIPALSSLGGALINEYLPGAGTAATPLISMGLNALADSLSAGGNTDDLWAGGNGGAMNAVNLVPEPGAVEADPRMVVTGSALKMYIANSVMALSNFRRATANGMARSALVSAFFGSVGLAQGLVVTRSGTGGGDVIALVVAPRPVRDPILPVMPQYTAFKGGKVTLLMDARVKSSGLTSMVVACCAAFQPYAELETAGPQTQYVTLIGLGNRSIEGGSLGAAAYAAASRMLMPIQLKAKASTPWGNSFWGEAERSAMKEFPYLTNLTICGGMRAEGDAAMFEQITDWEVYKRKLSTEGVEYLVICDPSSPAHRYGYIPEADRYCLSPFDIAAGFIRPSKPKRLAYFLSGPEGLKFLTSVIGSGGNIHVEIGASLDEKLETQLREKVEFKPDSGEMMYVTSTTSGSGAGIVQDLSEAQLSALVGKGMNMALNSPYNTNSRVGDAIRSTFGAILTLYKMLPGKDMMAKAYFSQNIGMSAKQAKLPSGAFAGKVLASIVNAYTRTNVGSVAADAAVNNRVNIFSRASEEVKEKYFSQTLPDMVRALGGEKQARNQLLQQLGSPISGEKEAQVSSGPRQRGMTVEEVAAARASNFRRLLESLPVRLGGVTRNTKVAFLLPADGYASVVKVSMRKEPRDWTPVITNAALALVASNVTRQANALSKIFSSAGYEYDTKIPRVKLEPTVSDSGVVSDQDLVRGLIDFYGRGGVYQRSVENMVKVLFKSSDQVTWEPLWDKDNCNFYFTYGGGTAGNLRDSGAAGVISGAADRPVAVKLFEMDDAPAFELQPKAPKKKVEKAAVGTSGSGTVAALPPEPSARGKERETVTPAPVPVPDAMGEVNEGLLSEFDFA